MENTSIASSTPGRSSYRAWAGAILSMLGARSLSAAAAFLANMLVAVQLGPERFGQFYLLFTIMTLVAGLTGPAIDTSLVRFASRQMAENQEGSLAYFKMVLYVKLLVLCATLGIAVITAPWLLRTFFSSGTEAAASRELIILAFLGGGVVSMWGFAQSYLQVQQRFTRYALLEFGSSAFRLVAVVGFAALGTASIAAYTGAYVVAPLLMAVVSWMMVPWAVFRAKTTALAGRELYHFGKWVMLATLFATLTQRLDLLLLNIDRFGIRAEEIGRYSAAVGLVLAGDLVMITFHHVLLPRASRLRSAGELRRFIGQFRVPSFLFCLALGALIPLTSVFVHHFLGPEYQGVEAYFTILLLGVMASVSCSPAFIALYSLGRSRTIAFFEGMRLALTLLAGLYAIPRYGPFGMAWAMMLVRTLASVVPYFVAHQEIKRLSYEE